MSQGQSSTFSAFRAPGFKHLATGYAVNELGNWLGEIALAVLVFEQTGSPLATAALFLAMQFLPAVVSPGLVARTESLGIKKMLPALYLLEAAVFVALAIASVHFALWVVLLLAAVDGSLAIAARAFTRAGAAAVLDPKGLLRQGNAVLNFSFTGAGAVGPAIAGIVVATLGVQAALFMDAASFLAVAVVLMAARALPDVTAKSSPWRERLSSGIAYVRSRRTLRRLIIGNAALLVFLTAVLPIEIVYATDTLDAGSSGYGAILAAWGIGMVLGSLIFAAAQQVRLQLLILFGALAVGASYLGFAAAPTLAIACIASAAGGAGNGVLWVSMVSAVQELTRTDYQARVMSLLESTSSAAPGLGFLIGGAVTQFLSPRTTFLVAGAGALIVVAVAIPALKQTSWSKRRSSEEMMVPDGAITASDSVSPTMYPL